MNRARTDETIRARDRSSPSNSSADWELITNIERTHRGPDGREYRVTIEGSPRDDGTWAGRVSFTGPDGALVTEQETSQPNREALEYWASGLEPVYFEGAFARATSRK